MSRIFRLAAALSALVALVAVPGALAKSTHKHHTRAHHRSVTKSDKTTIKKSEHTSSEHPGGSTTPSGGSGDSHPAPTPPTPPTSPAPPANAGTVVSFTDGVLTITLTGGATLTGTVPAGTPVICRPANHTRTDAPATGDHNEPTPTTTTTTPPPPPPATTPAPPAPPVATACGTAALVHGAVVHEAGLGLGPNGLRFTSIILVQA